MSETPEGQDHQSGFGEEQVINWITENPDLLQRHPTLIEILHPPGHNVSANVQDFQQAMIKSLQDKIARTEDLAFALIDNSRDNLSSQAQVHESILAILEANSFENLIDIITTEVAVLLDLEYVGLCIEGDIEDSIITNMQSHDRLTFAELGLADKLFPPKVNIVMDADIHGDSQLFGAASPIIRSQALVRLDISSHAPEVLLIFGSNNPEGFREDHATELLEFLSRVTGLMIRLWLNLPDE